MNRISVAMPETEPSPGSRTVPLAVSVDGALLKTDLFLEGLWAAFHAHGWTSLRVLARTPWSRAKLGPRLSDIALPDLALLPLNVPVMERIEAAVAQQRGVTLISDSDRGLVGQLAACLSVPGQTMGSDGNRSLSGAARASALVAAFGAGGFDYIGAARDEVPSWQLARGALVVAPTPKLAADLAALGKPVETIDIPRERGALLREMRPMQWVKNLLLLLPLLTAHDFSLARLIPVTWAILAFCAMTSSVYLVNDMLDLSSDRRHPEKRHRPIASGALSIRTAMTAVPILLSVAFGVGWSVNPSVAGVLLTYLCISTLYSLWLKHLPWLDLFVLATLYVLRVLAGAAAAGLDWPLWSVGFCLAVFVTLSVVKRLTGLARMEGSGAIRGRAYSRADVPALVGLGLAACLASVIIFLLYTWSPAAVALYSHPVLLRLGAIPIAVWLLRMVRLATQGQEDYDPVAFVTHDPLGLSIAAIGIALAVLAI
jgi:4-hydroxybenzoate polyprenyltransferase